MGQWITKLIEKKKKELKGTDKWYPNQPEWGTPEATKKARDMTPGQEKMDVAEATDKAPKWKRAGNDGEIEIKFPTGRRFKIEKQYDHNIRHKGEWKVMEWDTRSRDWEWADTYRPKAYAKEMAMKLGQYKNGKKVADYSHTFQYESYDWVCGKCNCEPCVCEGDGMEIKESVQEKVSLDKKIDIQKAIQKLDKKQQIAIKMYYWQNATYADIGKKLNLSASSARQILAKAEKRLKHPSISKGLKESVKPHPEVVKAYKKTIDAEDKAADYNYGATKARVTRAQNHLSKKIKQHHPDLDMNGKIKLRTALQNMKEDAMTTADAGIPQDTKNMGPKFKTTNVTDRRRRKDKHPVILKRFRKYIEDNA